MPCSGSETSESEKREGVRFITKRTEPGISREIYQVKLITLKENESRLEAIDTLVKQGVFSSRAEVYRAGALLMITLEDARRLSRLNLLEEGLYGRTVHRCLSMIREGDITGAGSILRQIEEALRLRGLIATLSGGLDSESVETLADGMGKYADTLARFDAFPDVTRKRMVSDLERDLKAIRNSLRTIPQEARPPKIRTK